MKYLALAALAGCSFPTPSEQYACETDGDCNGGRVCRQKFCVVDDGMLPDAAAADAPPDVPEGSLCTMFPARHFNACAIPMPSPGLDLAMPGLYVYDTNTAILTHPNATTSVPANQIVASGRLISVESFAIGGGTTLRVIGSQPLIVASWSTITIAVGGTLDASSGAVGTGAGANPAACNAHASVNGENDINGAGGGGGGGYRGRGGNGGDGSSGGGAGGNGGNNVALPLLLGGCSGATGGTADMPGGIGGAGGGAVQLTARTSITIAGIAHVGGSGGAGAPADGNDSDGGGGGGGSGGMVGLEAAGITIAATGILAANGGGGGEGADSNPGGRGEDGQIGTARAQGGSGGDSSNGGDGSAGGALNGNGGSSGSEGGGAGGGAAGYIAIARATPSLDPGAVISPAPTIIP